MKPDFVFAPGTLGHLFQSGAAKLAGLEGRTGAHALRIARAHFQPGEPDQDWGTTVGFDVVADDRAVSLDPEPWGPGEAEYPLQPDAFDRVRAALAEHAALDVDVLAFRMTPAILDALYPRPRPGSFTAWLAEHGGSVLGIGTGPIATVPAGASTVDVTIDDLTVGKRRDIVLESAVCIRRLDAGGAVLDRTESMVFWGRVHPEAFDHAAERLDDARVATLVDSWRDLVCTSLRALVEADPDRLPVPFQLFDDIPSLPLGLQSWVLDGIPADPTIRYWL